MAAGKPSKLRELLQVLPVAGVMCMIGAIGWAIWGAVKLGVIIWPPMALGGVGILFFLTTFISAEAANLKHYINTGFYTVFTVGICVVVYMYVQIHDRQIDLTPQKLHTLSEQTQKYLALLKKDVEVTVFDIERKPYENLLTRYAELSPRFKWSIHDPRRDPAFTAKFDPVIMDGTVYVTHGEKKKLLRDEAFGESTLTNAIVEVTRETAVKLYFLRGHGELSLRGSEGRQARTDLITGFANYMQSQSMQIAELDLMQKGFVPEDASLVIIAGPQNDLTDAEARAVERYLSRGGKLLVFLDVTTREDAPAFRNIGEILRRRGIEDTGNIVLDMLGDRQEGSFLKIPLKTYNDKHKITEQLARSGALMSVPLVRSIVALPQPPRDWLLAPLALSSSEAWTEPNTVLKRAMDNQEIPAPTKEQLGMQAIGWAIEAAKPNEHSPRIAVFGTSAFVRNQVYGSQRPAFDLVNNTVQWLVEQEDLIAIPPRSAESTPLILTNATMQLILILVGFALPATIFFGGVSYARLIRRS